MKKIALVIFAFLFAALLFAPTALATEIPPLDVTIGGDTEPDTASRLSDYFPFNLFGGDMTLEDATTTVEILVLLTILSLAPSILIMVTAFTRIVIVLSFTRSAMGTQQMPPNQVMIGLALFLTFFVMFPVYDEIKTNAWDPYAAEEIQLDEMIDRTIGPVRWFMFRQIGFMDNMEDLVNFMGIAGLDRPDSLEDIPTHVLIPAFIISEIKTGFIIGFMIYIPFIVIDMVVASALMSMGMMMLPPVMISLPFKIMLFVLVDGWNLTVRTLFNLFNTG